MTKRLLLVAVLLASILTVGFARQTRPGWEYHAETFGAISEKKLNELAAQGWELHVVAHQGDVNEFIFRRPKP